MLRKDLLMLALPLALAECTAKGAAAPVPPAGLADGATAASLDRLATAWNAGDGDAWAAEYWPDGSLINILGVVFDNAQAVGAVTNQILAGPFKGSTFAYTVRRVRTIDSVAIVETDVSVTNFRALPPGAVATKPGLLLTRLTHVYANRNAMWKIEASQNTSVLPR